jgi:hypothetical protein
MNSAVYIGFGWHEINTKFREVVRRNIHEKVSKSKAIPVTGREGP